MRSKSILSITFFLMAIFGIEGSPIAPTYGPGHLEENRNETSIEFEIEIPHGDQKKENIDGLVDFFEDFRNADPTEFPIKETNLRMCVAVVFPLSNVNNESDPFCDFELSNIRATIKNCMEEIVVNKSAYVTTDSRPRKSSNYDRYTGWDRCKEHVEVKGAPRVSLFMRKSSDQADWNGIVERMANENKNGLAIVGNNFGNRMINSTPFRFKVYEIGKPPKNLWNTNDAQVFFNDIQSKRMIAEIWKAIRGLLSRCNVTVYSGDCHYSTPTGVCSRQYRRNRTGVVNSIDEQYCLGNTFRNESQCTTTACDVVCERYELLQSCNATCEKKGVQRKVIHDPLHVDPYLHFCPANLKELYVACSVDCPGPEGGPIAMVTCGVLILCGVGALIFAGYWFLWRRRPGSETDAVSKKAGAIFIPRPTSASTPTETGQEVPAPSSVRESSKKSQIREPSKKSLVAAAS